MVNEEYEPHQVKKDDPDKKIYQQEFELCSHWKKR